MKLSTYTLISVAALVSWTCGGASPGVTPPSPTVSSVAVTATTTSLTNLGQTVQLTATATLSDGSTQNVTAIATWQSSNAAVATVSSGGLVTAVASGTVTMTVTYQGRTATISVAVAPTTSAGNSMSATIDGVPWTANPSLVLASAATTQSGTVIAVGGFDKFACPILGVAFGMPGAVGTYAIAPSSVANASVGTSNCRNGDWSSVYGGSGSITVATLTSNSASGTFAFSIAADRTSGATGTKVVTNGVFNVRF